MPDQKIPSICLDNKEKIEEMRLYLQQEVQLQSLECYETEDKEIVFVSPICLISFTNTHTDTNRIKINFDIETHPDVSSLISLALYDIILQNNESSDKLVIGSVYCIDNQGNVYFGDDAINRRQRNFQEYVQREVENLKKLDYILMNYSGGEC